MATKIMQLVDGIAALVQIKLIDPLMATEAGANILTATGFWLDRLGIRFKLSRSSSISLGTDAKYRSYLTAKAGQYITDGSIPDLDRILQASVGAPGGRYVDNGNLTLSVTIPSDMPQDEIDYVVANGLLPKPAGVSFSLVYVGGSTNKFGFNGNGKGFSQAPFGKTKVVGA